MATKLKLALQGPQSLLIIRSVIFAGFLILAKIGNLGLFPVLFFLGASAFLYTKPLFNIGRYFGLFVVLLLSLLFWARFLDKGDLWWFAIIAGFLFYLLMGIKDLILIRRDVWHRLLNFTLFYGLALLLLYSDFGAFFIPKLILFFVLSVCLAKDLFYEQNASTSWVAALLLSEIAVAVSFLPLGPLNGANLTLLSYFIISDVIINFAAGTLNRKLVLRDIALFVILTLLIFVTTKWGI